MQKHKRDHALLAEFVRAVFAPIYARCVRDHELNGYPPAWREHIVGETYIMARLLLEEHQKRLSVAAMLTAASSAQSDDYKMTNAEAKALSPAAEKNRAKVAAKSLPERKNDNAE